MITPDSKKPIRIVFQWKDKNINQQITYYISNGDELTFWGWLDSNGKIIASNISS